MTAEEYRALLDVDFNNVKIEDLTDIRKIKIDKKGTVTEGTSNGTGNITVTACAPYFGALVPLRVCIAKACRLRTCVTLTFVRLPKIS